MPEGLSVTAALDGWAGPVVPEELAVLAELD